MASPSMTTDWEDMLFRTVQMIESHNLTSILPDDVFAFWQAKKAEAEAEEERAKTEALKFCERRMEHWREQQAAASFVKNEAVK